MSNCIAPKTMDVITYPCTNINQTETINWPSNELMVKLITYSSYILACNKNVATRQKQKQNNKKNHACLHVSSLTVFAGFRLAFPNVHLCIHWKTIVPRWRTDITDLNKGTRLPGKYIVLRGNEVFSWNYAKKPNWNRPKIGLCGVNL